MLKTNSNEFKINKYISIRLEDRGIGKNTVICVEGKPFRQCNFLLLNIPVERIASFNDIESIDETAEELGPKLVWKRQFQFEILPETEFWAHCSNMQVWVENNYDTRLLHRTLAFPLLKKLTELGDSNAKKIFKDEIAKRFVSGNLNVISYLLSEGYIDLFNEEEKKILLINNVISNKLIKLMKKVTKLSILDSLKDFFKDNIFLLPGRLLTTFGKIIQKISQDDIQSIEDKHKYEYCFKRLFHELEDLLSYILNGFYSFDSHSKIEKIADLFEILLFLVNLRIQIIDEFLRYYRGECEYEDYDALENFYNRSSLSYGIKDKQYWVSYNYDFWTSNDFIPNSIKRFNEKKYEFLINQEATILGLGFNKRKLRKQSLKFLKQIKFEFKDKTEEFFINLLNANKRERIEKKLLKNLASEDSYERKFTAEDLGYINGKYKNKTHIEIIRELDNDLKNHIIDSLINTFYNTEDLRLRWHAAEDLMELGNKKGIEALKKNYNNIKFEYLKEKIEFYLKKEDL